MKARPRRDGLLLPSKTIWYFAYGANMCSAVLRDRRGIEPFSARPAFVSDYGVVFNMPGIWLLEPVFANLVAKAGAVAHGVLYELSPVALKKLRSMEGSAYLDVVLPVHTYTGEVREAHAYMGPTNLPLGKPSRRYLGLLVEGGREHKLPGEYLEKLMQTPSIHIPILSDLLPLLAFAEPLLRFRHHRDRATE